MRNILEHTAKQKEKSDRELKEVGGTHYKKPSNESQAHWKWYMIYIKSEPR